MRRRRRIPLLGRLSPSEICGHAAFVLSGSAFLEPEILQLRVLSVFAGSATLLFTYFHPIGSPLWLPFRWNIVFVLINSAYITKILAERRRAEQLPQQALDVWRDVFQPHGMCKVEFDGLLHAGTWTTLRKGAVLQEEGKPSNSLFLIVSGGATVSRGGEFTHSLGEQQFVGEMGLSSGIHLASPVLGVAHVETSEQTTVLVWSRRVLSELMDSSDALASGIRGAITADVVRKTRRLELEASSSTNTESVQRHGEQMEELWNARYASIIGALTSEGSISEEQREQVRSYRNLHQITGEAHVRALALQGWSASEFEAGERGESAKPGSAASADTAGGGDGAGLGGGSGGGASASMGGMVRRRRGGSSDGFGELRDAASKTLLGEGVREGVKARPRGEAARRRETLRPVTPFLRGQALNQRVEALRTAHVGTWGSDEPPLVIWDERRQKVAAVQERPTAETCPSLRLHFCLW